MISTVRDRPKFRWRFSGKAIVDLFAGAGGASEGISRALRDPDLALNHDVRALEMHAANHTRTIHWPQSLWNAKPAELLGKRRVGFLWASPDCTFFSKARGYKPVKKAIRCLAWCVTRWAREVRPDVIGMENVPEFENWGPTCSLYVCNSCKRKAGLRERPKRVKCDRCGRRTLVKTDKEVPDLSRPGETFRRWVKSLERLGYVVEWRVLNAADFGAPTRRRRFFLIARCDGKPIRWPEPTHYDARRKHKPEGWEKLLPWRPAAECIDWDLAGRSIFGRKHPLKPNTMRRIALGVWRYVVNSPDPFIVQCNHSGNEFRGQQLVDPLPTLTQSHSLKLVTPCVARLGQTGGNGKYCNDVTEPLTTITTKAEHILVSPTIVGVGGRSGQSPPASVEAPLGTITAKNDRALVGAHLAQHHGNSVGQALDDALGTICQTPHHDLVASLLTKHYGNGVFGVSMKDPVGSITTKDSQAYTAAHLVKYRHDSDGGDLQDPLPTITAGGGAARPAGAAHAMGLAAVHLSRNNHGDKQWNDLQEPLPVITSQTNKFELAAAHISRANFGDKQFDGANEPLGTITAGGNKFWLTAAFLMKYYGTAVGQSAQKPIDTITVKDRFQLVEVQLESGEKTKAFSVNVPNVGWCLIADIATRMLQPHELKLAQGFPQDYKIFGPKHEQVAKIGNSVPPQVVEALVRANYSLDDLQSTRKTPAVPDPGEERSRLRVPLDHRNVPDSPVVLGGPRRRSRGDRVRQGRDPKRRQQPRKVGRQG